MLPPDASGDSPYATGGGGVTLERRAAVVFLARLLTGQGSTELYGRRLQRVSFQQAPSHPIDDLVLVATGDAAAAPLVLELAIRRAPTFTASDSDTEHLFGKLLQALSMEANAGVERRLGICVAGPQTAASQVSELASLARNQATAEDFFGLVRTPRRFQRALRERLQHLVSLCAANSPRATTKSVEGATWALLGRLEILMPRLEPPDETDWNELLNQLEPWSREQTGPSAIALRDRLESLAAQYAPSAASVDLPTLRRATHAQLHVARRRARAWEELRRLDGDARADVRTELGLDSAALHLPRKGPATLVRDAVPWKDGVLITGESGVGKSALVLGELTALATADPATYDVLFLNLRLLPPTMAEVRGLLGAPLEDLLSEMSAPVRILVLDASDAVVERGDQLLGQLLRACRGADVAPWVVSATDGRSAVRAVAQQNTPGVREIAIGGLDDSELVAVAESFPHLRRLIAEPRAKELFRRPIIVDLFVRSGSQELPLSEADAFSIVWTQLVRNERRTSSGSPDARDQVLRQLALRQLRPTDSAVLYVSLNADAVGGLQHDAILRPPEVWQGLPSFAHDVLRTYAVARVLLSYDDPIRELLASGAPRWALPATRLALQVILGAPDSIESPLAGRFARIQSAVDPIAAAGYGDRWADLPTEALLTLPNARELLEDAWPNLLSTSAAGLRRVLRVLQQRHDSNGIIDRLVAEPVVQPLLEYGWQAGLQKDVDQTIEGWLRGLVSLGEPAGHAQRIALRERLATLVAAGDEREERHRSEAQARLDARTPDQIAADEERALRLRSLGSISRSSRSRQRLNPVPRELTEDTLLEQLALLGKDLGETGERLLRRVAADAPHHLAPAVERLLTGHGLVSYDPNLLIEIAEAYYVDENDTDDAIAGDGVRRHDYLGLLPMSAAYRGPFLALLRANGPAGIAFLNRLLNHAARARVKILGRLGRQRGPEQEDEHLELDISGQRRKYYGDEHVWRWYRAGGVGPYPCMSALQALELVCDEALEAEVPLSALVRVLLHGCENLAVPALVVGLLVRHLSRVKEELDPFLAEPDIWRLEFQRCIHERSGPVGHTEGIVAPERRNWSLREASMWLALHATGDRRQALRTVGDRLVERAEELAANTGYDAAALSEERAIVRGWAGSLDGDSFSITETDDGSLYVEQAADEDVVARLAPSNADLARGQNAMRLTYRYRERFDQAGNRIPVTRDELVADVLTARELLENPPHSGPGRPFDAPATVAAQTLETHFLDGIDLPETDLVWAAELLVNYLVVLAESGASDEDYSVFGLGADRSAARALPLLFLPQSSRLRELLATVGTGQDEIAKATAWIVHYGANEARLFHARGFDPVWGAACNTGAGPCHHFGALAVIEDIARHCLIGPRDPAVLERTRLRIDGPVATRLRQVSHERVYVPVLSAAIRGAWAAAVSNACCRTEAHELLAAMLQVHQTGMRAFENGYLHSEDDTAAAARAVLEVAARGDDSLLRAHVDNYSDSPRLLAEFLQALAAVGEETETRATAARGIWPALFERVVELVASGVCPRDDRYHRQDPLTRVIPRPAWSRHIHREYESEPILWEDPVPLAQLIESWLPLAAGHPDALDALLHLLTQVPPDTQAAIGLRWVEQLALADPSRIANRCFRLSEWLERVRPHASSPPLRLAWHRIVDALTVAGDDRVAALAD